MRKQYILVIDSGVGGASVLKELKNRFKSESFIYVLDNNFSPYGNKTKRVLCEHILKLINEYMIKYSIKLIIFACNTLTAATIKFVREKITIPIVGTEPPVKKVNKNLKTLVLATNATIKYSKLLKKFKKNNNFTFVGLKNVAKLLDENFYNREKILNELKKQIPKKKFKNVVLGCTHYYFLKREIYSVTFKVKFFDAINGICKRVNNLLVKNNKKENQSIKIFTTKKDVKLKKTIKDFLNI